MTTALRFAGRVIMEDGIFVLLVDDALWTTYHGTLRGVLDDTPRMVLDHLRVYDEHGQLDRYLRRLGADDPSAACVAVTVDIDCSEVAARNSSVHVWYTQLPSRPADKPA